MPDSLPDSVAAIFSSVEMVDQKTEARARAQKKYRETHREEIRARSRAYNAAHKEEIKARNARNRARIRETQRQWKDENPDRVLEHARKYRELRPEQIQEAKFKHRYGISTAEYNELLEKQGGGCAICGTKDPGGRARKHFFVDHDHQTQRVRGLLCNNHNLMLGHAQDTPEILERGAIYLRTHK